MSEALLQLHSGQDKYHYISFGHQQFLPLLQYAVCKNIAVSQVTQKALNADVLSESLGGESQITYYYDGLQPRVMQTDFLWGTRQSGESITSLWARTMHSFILIHFRCWRGLKRRVVANSFHDFWSSTLLVYIMHMLQFWTSHNIGSLAGVLRV